MLVVAVPRDAERNCQVLSGTYALCARFAEQSRSWHRLALYEVWPSLVQEADDKKEGTTSMVVVSEFVGCSPSVSGAIRVNPWSIDSVADGIYTAIQMPAGDRHLRHEKHWRYISGHTVGYWAQVSVACRVAGPTTTALSLYSW